eukprot:scaffold1965_cov151-Isochrysis_galbana.AAC.1
MGDVRMSRVEIHTIAVPGAGDVSRPTSDARRDQGWAGAAALPVSPSACAHLTLRGADPAGAAAATGAVIAAAARSAAAPDRAAGSPGRPLGQAAQGAAARQPAAHLAPDSARSRRRVDRQRLRRPNSAPARRHRLCARALVPRPGAATARLERARAGDPAGAGGCRAGGRQRAPAPQPPLLPLQRKRQPRHHPRQGRGRWHYS